MATTRIDPFGIRAVIASRPALTLLLMLVGADIAYFVAHVRTVALGVPHSLDFVDDETGYAEAFQTLQWLWVLGLLGLIIVGSRRWLFAGLLPLLALFLLTDRYAVHERAGQSLADAVGLPSILGLRPIDVGELLVIAAAAVIAVPALVVAVRRAGSPERRHFARILVLCACILFCGIVLDAVHILLIDDPRPGDAFGIVEDGGEMLGASMLVAYLLVLWLEPAPRSLGDAGRASLADGRRAPAAWRERDAVGSGERTRRSTMVE